MENKKARQRQTKKMSMWKMSEDKKKNQKKMKGEKKVKVERKNTFTIPKKKRKDGVSVLF